MSDAQEVFVGIDVSKEWFDVAVPGMSVGVDLKTRRV